MNACLRPSVQPTPSPPPWRRARPRLATGPGRRARLQGGGIGGFGGGSLGHPRRWLGAQWAGLFPGRAEPVEAVRCAVRRRGSRPCALPRGGLPRGGLRLGSVPAA
eukprot:scaffold37003_cov61-Phaeocystis_antarctica.AAC.1